MPSGWLATRRQLFHLPGDVAQDSIRPSGAGRVGEVYGLAEVSVGKIAVGDADGV